MMNHRHRQSSKNLKRHTPNAPASNRLEQLEQRRLLSAVFDVARVPTFVPTSPDIFDAKTGPLAKGGAVLAEIYTDYRRHVRSGESAESFVSRYDDSIRRDGNRIMMNLRTRGSMSDLRTVVRGLEGEMVYSSGQFRTASAWIPLGRLHDLAKDQRIVHARVDFKPNQAQQGFFDNEGNVAALNTKLREAFDVDGTGVSIGVLSDTVNAVGGGLKDSVQTGDLPARDLDDDAPAGTIADADVLVIEDGDDGSDEGRAMLELIHDVAPGSRLLYATAVISQQSFADNVRRLADAGADIIVDDIGWRDEPMFQDGLISQAIDYAVEQGSLYFSAAGNSGPSGYATRAEWVTSGGRTLIDFNPDSNAVDTRMTLRVRDAGQIIFQWSDPNNGVVADVRSDVDIRFYSTSGRLINAGLDDNFATGLPNESAFLFPGTYEVEIEAVNTIDDSNLPSLIRFQSWAGEMFDGRSDVEHPAASPTTFGHAAGTNTLSIGAVGYQISPAFGATPTYRNNDFSSFGFVEHAFDANGDALDSIRTLQKPDFSGIDGVTTGVPGFEEFFGTSAASPNLAATAALLWELAPDADASDIRQALVLSARQNPLNGAATGTWDTQGGFGLVDAVRAAHELLPELPIATFDPISPNPKTNGPNEITVRFTEPVTGVELSDFFLTRDLRGGNLIDSNVTLTAVDSQTYVLGNVRRLVRSEATYRIEFIGGSDADVTDPDDNLAAGAIATFVSKLPKPLAPSSLIADPGQNNTVLLRFNDNASNETGYRIERSTDPTFRTNVVTRALPANDESEDNAITFTDSGLRAGTLYYYRVRGFTDTNDNRRFGAPSNVASTLTLSAGEQIVDNSSATFLGPWTEVTATNAESSPYFGTYHRINAAPSSLLPGNTRGSATFTSDGLTNNREYWVYARWTSFNSGSTNDKNVFVDVLNGTRVNRAQIVDQSDRGGGWVLLGKYRNTTAAPLAVRIRQMAGDGIVTADAARFLPVSGSVAPNASGFNSNGFSSSGSSFASGSTIGGASDRAGGRSDSDDADRSNNPSGVIA